MLRGGGGGKWWLDYLNPNSVGSQCVESFELRVFLVLKYS